jgi:hypothetical protein
LIRSKIEEGKMSNIVPFEFKGKIFRIVDQDGVIWLVAQQVAKTLGYKNTSKAISDHCKHARMFNYNELLELGFDNPSRSGMLFIPEGEKGAPQPKPTKSYPFDDTHHFPKQEPPPPNEAPPGYDSAQNEKPEERKEAPQPGQQLVPLTEGDLQAVGPDGKRRLPATRLGQRLGYTRDRDVRRLIQNRLSDLQKASPVVFITITPRHGDAPVQEPFLDA